MDFVLLLPVHCPSRLGPLAVLREWDDALGLGGGWQPHRSKWTHLWPGGLSVHSGVIRNNRLLLRVSLAVAFLYGGIRGGCPHRRPRQLGRPPERRHGRHLLASGLPRARPQRSRVHVSSAKTPTPRCLNGGWRHIPTIPTPWQATRRRGCNATIQTTTRQDAVAFNRNPRQCLRPSAGHKRPKVEISC